MTIGIPVPAAAGLIYLAAGSLGWLAVVVARIEFVTGLILAGWLAVLAAVLGLLLVGVPVYTNCRRHHYVLTNVDVDRGLTSTAYQEIGLDGRSRPAEQGSEAWPDDKHHVRGLVRSRNRPTSERPAMLGLVVLVASRLHYPFPRGWPMKVLSVEASAASSGAT